MKGDLTNGFTYNIPIQHIQQQQQQQIQLQPHQIKYQPSSGGSPGPALFRNFIITPQQDGTATLNGNGISVNTNAKGEHTYTVPVNLQLSNQSTVSYNGSSSANGSNGHMSDFNEGGFNIRTNFVTSNGHNNGSPPPPSNSNMYISSNGSKPQSNSFKTLVNGNIYGKTCVQV